jgi:hypothetical protein
MWLGHLSVSVCLRKQAKNLPGAFRIEALLMQEWNDQPSLHGRKRKGKVVINQVIL